jgi:hypothetical protein
MSGGGVAEMIAILAVFLGGVALGVLVIVCAAIKREDRKLSLRKAAPGAVERGTRVLTGVGSRDSNSRDSNSRDSNSRDSSSRYPSERSP